ncbi:hypothetical protein Tco_0673400 [Tanacetum coccineum]
MPSPPLDTLEFDMKLATPAESSNGIVCDGNELVIKDLDLEPKYNMSNLVDDVLLRKCLYIRDCERLGNIYLSFHHEIYHSMDFLEHEARILTQLYTVLLVSITGTSQSRQHESRKSPTAELFDVDSRRFPFITVNNKEYHSECSGNYHKDNA